jgi:hypothetical protein
VQQKFSKLRISILTDVLREKDESNAVFAGSYIHYCCLNHQKIPVYGKVSGHHNWLRSACSYGIIFLQWLNNCVGRRNYASFVALMATSLLLVSSFQYVTDKVVLDLTVAPFRHHPPIFYDMVSVQFGVMKIADAKSIRSLEYWKCTCMWRGRLMFYWCGFGTEFLLVGKYTACPGMRNRNSSICTVSPGQDWDRGPDCE